jgi:hypothetical protein
MSRALSDLFDKALRIGGNTHTRQDIAEGIKSGRYQYFGDDISCIVTEIVEYPQTRRLHILIGAGDYSQIATRWIPTAKEFAIQNGCSSMTTAARRGFLKRLPRIGWRPTHTVFELKLEDAR